MLHGIFHTQLLIFFVLYALSFHYYVVKRLSFLAQPIFYFVGFLYLYWYLPLS